MASSATDAGNSEKLIRQKLIETGGVDCIVAVGNNFFYTRSLPCHLWFLDRGKAEKNKNKILMIDARNTFRQINATLRDFSPEQMQGLTAIIKAYRGEDVAKDFASNPWLKETFAGGKYEDVEGLCKIVDVKEVEENDWSLTPGRYVGYSIELDEDFDYAKRLGEIHDELKGLNDEAAVLMEKILRGVA
jgi:type I restriction enzyme M protein